ncbi:MAG: hypothetical protein C0425_10445 [Chlorobiaceae bacterium]|nr:hypothetical protein [Chlorobiaceae bacterium]MBA4310736.1 hypothetical protein [Chlorobiaceae bacterium]
MKEFPLIKILFSVISGIILQNFLQLNSSELFLTFSIVLVILFLMLFLKKYFTQTNIISSLMIIFCSIMIGAISHRLQNYPPTKELFTEELVTNVTAYGKVVSVDLSRRKEFRFELKLDSIITNDRKIIGNVNLICRIKEENNLLLEQSFNLIFPGNYVKINGIFNAGKEDRNPGEFNYRDYLRKIGISGIITAQESRDLRIINLERTFFLSEIFSFRKTLAEIINENQSHQTAGLLKGLLLADRSEIDYETKMDFQNAGVIHVLAVSGQNVGFIALIFVIIFGRFNVYLKTILTIIGMVIFILITGFQPSVFRATLMGVIFFVAFLTNRDKNLYNIIALSALIILLIRPNDLFDAGFQLSYSAVLAMVLIFPYFDKVISGLKTNYNSLYWLLALMLVSFAAQLGTMPLTNIFFSQLSIVALFANLIVIPGVTILIANGLILFFVSIFSFQLTNLIASANELITNVIFGFVHYAANLDYSFVFIRGFTTMDAIIFYLLMLLFFVSLKYFQNLKAKILLLFLVIINIFVITALDNKSILAKSKLNFLSIDVGESSSYLITTPSNESILINAGIANQQFNSGQRTIIPLLDHLNVDKIDYLILSSAEYLKLASFVELINEERVKNLVLPNFLSEGVFIKLKNLANRKNVNVITDIGNQINLSDSRIYFTKKNKKEFNIKFAYDNTSIFFANNFESYQKKINSDILVTNENIFNLKSESIKEINPSIVIFERTRIKNRAINHQLEILNKEFQHVRFISPDDDGAIFFNSDGINFSQIKWK